MINITDKQKELYETYSHYKKLPENEKQSFWQKRALAYEGLSAEDKQQAEAATWANINDIKAHLLKLTERLSLKTE